MSRRAIYVALVLACGLMAVNEYRIFAHSPSPDPRLRAVLNTIRESGLEDKALLLPQEDVPMVHYYFPAARLRGYLGKEPIFPGGNALKPDGVLYPGFPIRLILSR